jgi:integrase
MRVPSYRLHKATGQAVVTIRGKDHYLGKHGSSESKERYRQTIANHLTNSPDDPPPNEVKVDLTTGQAVALFRDTLKDESARLQNHFKIALASLLKWEKEPIANFGTARYSEVRSQFASSGWNQTHCNQQLSRVKQFLRWLSIQEVYPVMQLAAIREVPSLDGRETRMPRDIKPVPLQVVEETLPQLSAFVRGAIQFMWLTGCRPKEVLSMRPNLIDRSGTIYIDKSDAETYDDVWIYRPATHKTFWRGISRQILIGPQCQELLKPFLGLILPDEYVFPPGRSYGEPKPMDVGTLAKNVRLAVQRAEVEPWFPYQIRHSAATRFRREGNKDIAGTLLGHIDRSVTARYAREDWGKAVEVIKKVG